MASEVQDKYYAGVGSRSTPMHIQKLFEEIAATLAQNGYVLRSGGAEGADVAFERGCKTVKNHRKEIFIPWKGFAKNDSPLYDVPAAATKMASEIHPAWDKCSKWVRLLHGRNCMQILGATLDTPCEFVLCWTPNGEAEGGTATAINLAIKHDIPIYNFAKQEDIERFSAKVMPIEVDETKGYDFIF